MGFDNLSAFFKKFNALSIPDETVRRTTAQVVKDVMGITIDIKAIHFKNGVISISADPLIKSEVFMRKTDILAKIKILCVNKTINDIR